MPFDIKEIQAKGILTKCGIPGIDFVVNPYIGCRFGCKYCYASFMGRFVGKKIADWGEYVYPKINAPELLAKEIERKLPDKGRRKEVFFSSVTDPYQGLEAKYKLTRQCLSVLADWGFAGTLSIRVSKPGVEKSGGVKGIWGGIIFLNVRYSVYSGESGEG